MFRQNENETLAIVSYITVCDIKVIKLSKGLFTLWQWQFAKGLC